MKLNEIKNAADAVTYILEQIELGKQDLLDEEYIYNVVDLTDDLSDLKRYFEDKENPNVFFNEKYNRASERGSDFPVLTKPYDGKPLFEKRKEEEI